MISSDNILLFGTPWKPLCGEVESCRLVIFWMHLQRSVQMIYGGVDMKSEKEED